MSTEISVLPKKERDALSNGIQQGFHSATKTGQLDRKAQRNAEKICLISGNGT